MSAVEWNLAALQQWEALTGRNYKELPELTQNIDELSITDLSNILIAGMYGAEFPKANIDEIKSRVLALKPDEMQDFFSALQQQEVEDQ